MSVEQPFHGVIYRIAIDPFCAAQGNKHGARPAVHGQTVRFLRMEPDTEFGHVYACELLSGSDEPIPGITINGKPVTVRGSTQYFAPSELMERDLVAEIANATNHPR